MPCRYWVGNSVGEAGGGLGRCDNADARIVVEDRGAVNAELLLGTDGPRMDAIWPFGPGAIIRALFALCLSQVINRGKTGFVQPEKGREKWLNAALALYCLCWVEVRQEQDEIMTQGWSHAAE